MESIGEIDSSTFQPRTKLFIGQIPQEINEEILGEYFTKYGEVKEIVIIRDPFSGQSRGCAFVTYSTHDSAQQAVTNLHNNLSLTSGSSIQVRFAETASDRENKLFVGMLPKTFDESDLSSMFGAFGQIREIHVIRGHEGSPKGCAFIKYAMKESAFAAIDSLHETIPPGGTRPLVVKFADNKKVNKLNVKSSNINDDPSSIGSVTIPAATYSQDARFSSVNNSFVSTNPHFNQNRTVPLVNHPLSDEKMVSAAVQINLMPLQHLRPPEGPNGANLFIYHLPRDITDADLATLFAPFGNVISAKVFVDKKTSDSKGFGFVSYDSYASANNAIDAMNGFQIGSKRLKVQHKRVSDEALPVTMNKSGQSIPSFMAPFPVLYPVVASHDMADFSVVPSFQQHLPEVSQMQLARW